MRARGFGATDKGRKRSENEDCFGVHEDLGLFVVSDGMGGHAAGEVASSVSVETVVATVRAETAQLERIRRGQPAEKQAVELAEMAVSAAAREVHRRATEDEGLAGMGSTLSVLLIAGDQAALAHVGDSRVYRFRDGTVEQLSTDHTMAEDLVRAGAATREMANRGPLAHVLTRSIGRDPEVEIDALTPDLAPGDRLLMCSDGLSDYASDPRVLEERLGGDRETSAQALIAHALDSGGKDNVTVVLVDLEDEDEPRQDG